MTRHLFCVRFFFLGGGRLGVVTIYKIIATIVGNSRGTFNTITRQIPKFFEIYTQHSGNVQ